MNKKAKRILAVVLAMAMVLAMGVPAMANNAEPVKGDQVTIRLTGDDTVFHCAHGKDDMNAAGRVYVDNDFTKEDLTFEYLGRTADVEKELGVKFPNRMSNGYVWLLLSNDYTCTVFPSGAPGCGDNVWYAYSNQSTALDGKNAQLIHPGEPSKDGISGVSVTKFLDDAPAGGFEFVLERWNGADWGQVGPSVKSEINGIADFGDIITVAGDYRIREVNLDTDLYESVTTVITFTVTQADLDASKKFDGPEFEWDNITKPQLGNVKLNADATLTTTTKTTLEKWQGSFTPWETWKDVFKGYGSVTATNPGVETRVIPTLNPKNGNPQAATYTSGVGVVPNSNHFTYATLKRADLVDGVTLDLVVGNNFAKVGEMTVTLEGNNLVLSNFSGEKDTYSFGAIAFNKYNINFPKNGNIHSQKEADLVKEVGATTGFNHNNKSVIPCPSGETIYLYVHFATLNQFQGQQKVASGTCTFAPELIWGPQVINVDKAKTDVIVNVELFDAEGTPIDIVQNPNGSWSAVEDLEPGTYAIKYYDTYLEQEFEDTVEVTAGNIAEAAYSAKHKTDAPDIQVRKDLDPVENPMANKCTCGKCR